MKMTEVSLPPNVTQVPAIVGVWTSLELNSLDQDLLPANLAFLASKVRLIILLSSIFVSVSI